MLALGINGSPRRNGNTAAMVGWVLEELGSRGIETEMLHLAGKPLRGCIDCRRCFVTQDKHCTIRGDAFNDVMDRMLAADALIIGTPTYFANVCAEVKALIERAGMVDAANGCLLKYKVGAAAVSARRGGAIDAFNAVNHLFLHAQMIVPGSNYWNVGHARHGSGVSEDTEAEKTMRILGQNIAWLLARVAAADPADEIADDHAGKNAP